MALTRFTIASSARVTSRCTACNKIHTAQATMRLSAPRCR